ncbi:flavin monoamine oxidase family protein [Nonomuraea sp. NPDC059007]|uniref:flavin monoamine oxidase family protein n=1 Tax=Nonomuraea sp. NPDC059007 TaxID=3346692 RepID=UPI0036A2EEBE
MIEKTADAVVVGGGLSGLTAAYRLASGGVDTVVLEAGERVGGRVWNIPLAGDKATEAGAMYVCASQREILTLAAELGVELFPSFKDGIGVAHLGGRRFEYANGLPDLPQDAVREYAGALKAMERIDHDDPRLDAIDLAAWRDERIHDPLARQLFDCSVSAWFAAPPDEISFAYALHATATCGGIRPMLRDQDSVLRFAAGSQALPDALAAYLGERVCLGEPVREVERDGSGVVVGTPGLRVRARRVIMAIGPAATGPVSFRPGLPPARTALAEGWVRGPLIKTNVVYDEPFWRKHGLSGSGFTDLGAAPGFLDASPPDGSPGVLALTAFTFSERHFRGNPPAFSTDHQVRRAATLEALAACLGPEAARPVAYLETDWRRQPYVFGCQGGLRPGALTAAGPAPHAPAGGLHWAGTESADRWTGWMNGAVQAGERCAREVLDRL